jgi:monofunctional biosynthetic peptidoglycan transglycosylase
MRRALKAAGLAAGLLIFWLFAVWPPPLWYRTHWPRQTAFMTRPQATAISRVARARGRLYRPVPLDSINPVMQDAVMIGEDNKFLTHHGIDYLSMAQALGYPRQTFDWGNRRQRQELLAVLPNAWSRRDKLRGASTITQQLAKNLYLSPSRNPLRKVKEAVTAWRLEAALGKRRIMELYLNVVELGEDVWGTEAASQLYFHRSALRISREDAAALAGSLPFPLRSNPELRPGRMRWRQNLILRRMRGEEVEVPRALEEDLPPIRADTSGDSTTVIDDSAGAGDTVAVPPDSVPAPVAGDSSP